MAREKQEEEEEEVRWGRARVVAAATGLAEGAEGAALVGSASGSCTLEKRRSTTEPPTSSREPREAPEVGAEEAMAEATS